jgi:hypothetical protein
LREYATGGNPNNAIAVEHPAPKMEMIDGTPHSTIRHPHLSGQTDVESVVEMAPDLVSTFRKAFTDGLIMVQTTDAMVWKVPANAAKGSIRMRAVLS